MQKKLPVLLGVGCLGVVVLVVIVGIAAVSLVSRAFDWGKQQVALEQGRRELVDNWQPPAEGASLDNFFPAKVGGYELESHDEDAAIPEFHFDLDGRHATYRSNDSQIEVFVYRVTEQEKESLFQRMNDVYEEDESHFKTKSEMNYRLYYSSSQHHQNHFWWTKGWLFVFRTDDAEDREPFVEKLLQATSG